MSGMMRIESIMSTLSGLGGFLDDLQRVEVLESIFQELNPKESK